MEDVSPLTGSSQENVLSTNQNNDKSSFPLKAYDVAIAILILGIGAAVGYATYKLCGRVDAASGVGAGFPVIAGGSYIIYRACSSKKKAADPVEVVPRDFINNIHIRGQLRELELPKMINDEGREKRILQKTDIVQHSTQAKFHVPVNAETIENLGLQPKYVITVFGKEIYLSEPFVVEDYSPEMDGRKRQCLSTLAYIPNDENFKFSLRIFYQSPTHGIWKVGEYVNGMGKFGEDISHPENTIVPFVEIGLAIEAIIASRQPLILEGQVSEAFSYSYAKCFQLSIAEFKAMVSSSIKLDSIKGQIRSTQILFESKSPGLSQLNLLNESWSPNFNESTFYPLRGPHFQEGFCVIVPSKNEAFRYVFFLTKAEFFDGEKKEIVWQEKYAHPTLACIEYIGKNQRLTTFGTYKDVIDTLGATVPALDVPSNVPSVCKKKLLAVVNEGNEPLNVKDGSLPYYPTWNCHREQLLILQEFMQWLNTLPEDPY